MDRPDRNPATAEEPATSAQETPGPASEGSAPAVEDGSEDGAEGGPAPEPAAGPERGRGAAPGSDAYRPL
ncbi:hypothetical protein [Streptacidiphilus albus]|uniref:hypothetical protein n=1 Tax=Streptacidiphilus albus TaxID=105425 RepID=UPI00054C4741|nr:hypothetical protein [Streptacidiphilus albus]